jgi:tRNA threonylcarbamoyl adenosine modification protein (Sua5/YciO/YrdC/YwlC family)
MGVSYYSRTAQKRLRQLKSRKNAKPFQVLVGSKEEAWRLATAKTSTKRKIEKYWPGPLTAVLPRKGGGTIGLRVPSHPLALALLKETGPLYASSANFSSATAPRRLKDVSPLIKKRADIILECPPQPKGVASTVVDFTGMKPRVLRQGALLVARDL